MFHSEQGSFDQFDEMWKISLVDDLSPELFFFFFFAEKHWLGALMWQKVLDLIVKSMLCWT